MQASEKVILVFRFSAMGDVAMTVPVLKRVVELNPDKEFVMISDQQFEALFQEIEGLKFEGFDLKAHYKGLSGIFKIFQYLINEYNVYAIVDLHNVLRTQVLRILFLLFNKKISAIDKGRKGKRALTRKNNKSFIALPHTIQRYIDTFKSLSIKVIKEFIHREKRNPFYCQENRICTFCQASIKNVSNRKDGTDH
jgi:ADP-heptose:LPS heptosyltransferase